MSVSIPRDTYDNCRLSCLAASDHLMALATRLPSADDFCRAAFFLISQTLIDTAALMAKGALNESEPEVYTIEDALFDNFLERIAGIIGIVTAFSESLGAARFARLTGLLLISFTRLYNFRLTRQ